MGIFYHITCRNKECRYHAELREGNNMYQCRKAKQMTEQIRSGELKVSDKIMQLLELKVSDKIMQLLEAGNKIQFVANYLCPKCCEFQTRGEPYLLEELHVSPYGTIREYKLHYIYGTPVCETCGSELYHILNPRSSKVKCLKCGRDNMKVGGMGYND